MFSNCPGSSWIVLYRLNYKVRGCHLGGEARVATQTGFIARVEIVDDVQQTRQTSPGLERGFVLLFVPHKAQRVAEILLELLTFESFIVRLHIFVTIHLFGVLVEGLGQQHVLWVVERSQLCLLNQVSLLALFLIIDLWRRPSGGRTMLPISWCVFVSLTSLWC